MTVVWGEGLPTLAQPSTEKIAQDTLLEAALSLRAAVDALLVERATPPIVNVERQDLGEIVTAVQGLKPGAGAEEIADAIARRLNPPSDPVDAVSPVLAELRDVLKSLDWRMKGLGQSGGSHNVVTGHVTATLEAGQGLATEAGQGTHSGLLADIKRSVTDWQTLLDYGSRVDSLPVYVGKNTQGTAQGTATWVIQRLSYDVTSRLTDAQVLTGSWTGRAALGWV